MHGEGPGLVQGEAGLHVAPEAAAEGEQVLLQRHVVEGQRAGVIVQHHADAHRVHRDAQVRAPAVVEELVLVPDKCERTPIIVG